MSISLVLTLMLTAFAGIIAFPVTANDVKVYDSPMALYTGQNNIVGNVTVTDDENFINVVYELDQDAIDDGWYITETHIHVDGELADFPLNDKGNPKVGLFDYTAAPMDTDYTEEIPLYRWSGDVFIAAHAVIERQECITYEYTFNSTDDGETLYYDGTDWSPAVKTYTHPNWATYTISDADWIWDSYYVTDPVNGQTLDFKREFSITGIPTSGTLWINADNGYIASLYETAFSESEGSWQSIEEYDISSYLSSGSNSLEITATNNPQSGGTEFSNPAGIIYKLEIESEECFTYTESCWADGTRFVEKGNWATYFSYSQQPVLLSVEYDGDGDGTFGDPGEFLNLTFSNNVCLDGNDQQDAECKVFFDESNRLGYNDNYMEYSAVDNQIIIKCVGQFGGERPHIGENVVDLHGIVDDEGNPVIVPSGGIEVIIKT